MQSFNKLILAIKHGGRRSASTSDMLHHMMFSRVAAIARANPCASVARYSRVKDSSFSPLMMFCAATTARLRCKKIEPTRTTPIPPVARFRDVRAVCRRSLNCIREEQETGGNVAIARPRNVSIESRRDPLKRAEIPGEAEPPFLFQLTASIRVAEQKAFAFPLRSCRRPR